MRFKPKKKLGQNFLVNKKVLRRIIEACGLKQEDNVLEIGCGRGELTGLISEKAHQVIAVEFDDKLYEKSKEKFSKQKNIKLINSDILRVRLPELMPQKNIKYIVVGNIPYYISTPILEWLIENLFNIKKAVLTVQKEFADRIVAKSGSKKYGALSCYVQYYFLAKKAFTIKKGSFYPMPKVDSSLLILEAREAPCVKVEDSKRFFSIIRTAFNQRRKTLRKSLKKFFNSSSMEDFLKENNLSLNSRPEELSLEKFASLSNTKILKK